MLTPYGKKSRLENSINVQRVKKYNKISFIKYKDSGKPPRDLFDLSTEDKRQGNERGREPLLSVWQSTIDRNTLIDNLYAADSAGHTAYELNTGEIHQIKVPNKRMTLLEVHGDSIEDCQSGNLHAGIQGLYRKPEIPKADYKYIKDELVNLSRNV